MFVSIVHADGRRYTIPAEQVVVHTDDGYPCSLSYKYAGLIVHSDTTSDDFNQQCAQLKVKKIEPPTVKAP